MQSMQMLVPVCTCRLLSFALGQLPQILCMTYAPVFYSQSGLGVRSKNCSESILICAFFHRTIYWLGMQAPP